MGATDNLMSFEKMYAGMHPHHTQMFPFALAVTQWFSTVVLKVACGSQAPLVRPSAVFQ